MKRKVTLLLLLFCMLTLHAQEVYKTVKDLPYIAKSETDAYRKERCKLDVYYPVDKKDFPTIVWFHGGGLEGGGKHIPQELAKAPLAEVFVSPLGDDNGAFTYSAQGFGAMNAARGGRHTGQDLNGIGGENTDEGLPVRAAGRGLLIYAGEPSPDWGNVVVLLHRLPDGRFVQSLYAHLKTISDIPLGTIVGREEQIGTVGTAHGNYLAHLHFEMIESIAHEAGMPGYGKTTFNRINPDEVLEKYAPDPAMMIPDPVIALKDVQQAAGWEKLLENLYRDNSMEALDKILPKEQQEGALEPAP